MAEEAEAVALASVTGSGSATLADFYAAELHAYFARHHHFFQHCLAREGAVAGIRQGYRATFFPSYGVEMRGGTASWLLGRRHEFRRKRH